METVEGYKKRLVLMDEREGTLAKVFGLMAPRVERAVFIMMDKLYPAYQGGYWEFVHVESTDPEVPSAFYMYPLLREAEIEIRWEDNCSKEKVSCETAGIVAMLFALSHLSFAVEASEKLSTMYMALLDYAMSHPDGAKIAAMID